MFDHATTAARLSAMTPEVTFEGRPAAVEVRGLTIVRGRITVLREVDLTVSPGEIVALQGPNGAGKSTLLHCFAGALRPTRGDVRWFDEPAGLTSNVRRRIGFLGHESGLYPSMTTSEILVFGGRMYDVDQPAKRAERWLTDAGLSQQAGQLVGRLSRGQRQRLAIARSVLHEPAVLLLDEPFTSLDAAGEEWLRSLLHRLRDDGCAILIAGHDLEAVAVDRTVFLHRGRRTKCELV